MSAMRGVVVLIVKVIMLFVDASFTIPEGMSHIKLLFINVFI